MRFSTEKDTGRVENGKSHHVAIRHPFLEWDKTPPLAWKKPQIAKTNNLGNKSLEQRIIQSQQLENTAFGSRQNGVLF